MAFTRPTLTELTDRIEADFVSRLNLSGGALLRRAMVRVLARVIAGAAHMAHGHLDYLARQLFPDQSDEEVLVRQAELFGLTRNPATYAEGTVTITGTNGVIVPAGTILLRVDGAEYETDADVTIAAGTATASVTASEAGADGTLEVGQVLTFETPIGGVTSTATVASSTADGSDQESADDLRERLLERMSDPPHGGNSDDYVAWAKEITGVTRVWVTPQGLGPGTVVVRFVRDDDASPIPDSGEVAAVQAKLNAEAPAHATPTAVAPTAAPLAFNMHIVPDTSATRAAVQAELADLLLREGEPGGTILLSHIRTAIGTADGITDYTLASPAADVTHTANQLPTMGAITFT